MYRESTMRRNGAKNNEKFFEPPVHDAIIIHGLKIDYPMQGTRRLDLL